MRPYNPDKPSSPKNGRGRPRKAPAKPREALSADPPKEIAAGMTAEARKVYKQLAERLAAEGYAAAVDARVVALCARQWVLVDRIEAEVAALPELTVETVQGGPKLHPLVGELRAAQSRLQQLLGALLMTPRARSASRLSKDWRGDGAGKGDELDDFLSGRA